MIAAALLAILAAGLTARLLVSPALKWLTDRGLLTPNYQGRPLPCGLGLILIPAYFTGTAAFGLALGRTWSEALPLAVALGGLGLIGFADDVLGQGYHGGMRRHGAILLREGRLTTGGLKALGAATVALTLTGVRPPPPGFLVDAGLIALGANAVNLLDARPGRALGAFWLMILAVVVAAAERGAVLPVLPLAAASLAIAPADFARRGMLGDAGANALGGAAGFFAVQALSPAGRETALTLLVMLHVAGEFGSLSRLIERMIGLRAVLVRSVMRGQGSTKR
ncbi:MAG TPA: hypothetical protein DEQ28_02980 [Clostridiales bacterium]|nr:hypothetical protein [Clostridiales bacterium]